jgi:KDO2-lipid IV(A) lauroyltransferase
MKKDSAIDFLGFIAAKAAGGFFCFLPLKFALWIGRRIGDMAYALHSKRRSISYANLKAAFPGKSCREIKNINRGHFRNLAMSVVELFRLPVTGQDYLNRYVMIKGLENEDIVLKKDKGLIVLTGHFGNWEIASLASSLRGHTMSVFAREQKYKRLNALLNRYRKMTGCKVITKGFSIREIIKTLNNNGIVAMLGDQNAGPGGILIDFFGRPASTAPGAVAFSIKTGAEIMLAFMRRVAFDRHEVIFEKPLALIDTGNKDKDIKENLKNISAIFENYIRKFPDQWLWSHKRWKMTSERRVLVLTDGKIGHINQSMAVANMIEGALRSRLRKLGIEELPIVKIDSVELRFKNRFSRFLLDIAGLFAGRHCQGCLRCLKFCLTKDTFEKIKGYADIVISCGASTVVANIFLKYENNANNAVIMKPGPGRCGKFNLIILPRHDAPKKIRPNMLITEAAPNSIEPRVNSNSGIGLLVGGDAKGFKLTAESVEKACEAVVKIAREAERDIFVTTSRRTSPEIGSFLKNRLTGNDRCKMLVIANEKNVEGAVSKILDASEIVIVSPESVSMISEAVSSGRYTVVFDSGVIAGKYERVIKNLEIQGYIKITKPEGIYDVIKEILTQRPAVKRLEDNEKIKERLNSLL